MQKIGRKSYRKKHSKEVASSLGSISYRTRKKMFHNWQLLLLATLLLVAKIHALQVSFSEENGMKSAVYLSPKIILGPGYVADKEFKNVGFPKGHIALKEFMVEIVDESGISVPLYDTYVHHWSMRRYYALTDPKDGKELDTISVSNSGVCYLLNQMFGLGSETRQTDTYVPDPYGIEFGNPVHIPNGYEERWELDVHAIDTRGAVDRAGCTECRCSLYNVTLDKIGRPLKPDYPGGFLCCYDNVQCKVKEGFESVQLQRTIYMKYTVKWVDWADTIIPVSIYYIDVTDNGEIVGTNDSGIRNTALHDCKVEYNVEPCPVASNGCVDAKKTNIVMPKGGHLIYGSAHQHTWGVGITVYGEDGRELCESVPIYGKGVEAGNEAGYIVGMTTCYPRPGSVKIYDGETLLLVSRYNSTEMHTGVMGFFYLLIVDQLPDEISLNHRLRNARENGNQPLVV